MNSQQELLDAINEISKSKNSSYDTPASVLRVEGDTVWVHIDGGADETPVSKTINCEEGETVQVRISGGQAFLVGNASAPPTDDKTANEARFVAEQASTRAEAALKSTEALSQTVEEKVSIGDSNIDVLSSTMYQNANGVNIYNDTLAVGDSYAHIDGDSFDIKEVTTAGTIDDTNDPVLATFGADGAVIGRTDESGYHLGLASDGIELVHESAPPIPTKVGWSITQDSISSIRSGALSGPTASLGTYGGLFVGGGPMNPSSSTIKYGTATFFKSNAGTMVGQTQIDGGDIQIDGHVTDSIGNNLTPTVLTETSYTDSSGTRTFEFWDASITTTSKIDYYANVFGVAPTDVVVSSSSLQVKFKTSDGVTECGVEIK